MSISNLSIAKALRDHLKAMPKAPTIIERGDKPPANKPHLRETPLFGPDEPITISDSEQQTGIYQIDVLTPADANKWKNIEIQDAVKKHFRRTLELEHNGQKVKIVAKSTSNPRNEDVWMAVSISITYTTFG